MKPVDLSGSSGLLRGARGNPFIIKGTTWPGAETSSGVVHGLKKQPLDFYMDFLSSEHFNAIRVTISHISVLENKRISVDSVDATMNPTFVDRTGTMGLTYREALRALVHAAAARQIVVIFACQRLRPDKATSNLWYDHMIGVSEDTTKASWEIIADAFCSEWNVAGVDLFQEPHNATVRCHLVPLLWPLLGFELPHAHLQPEI
jgi:aryl-phospho-beta-D-glucosidase BglC (GH1 family)